jgi:hypothetical protein
VSHCVIEFSNASGIFDKKLECQVVALGYCACVHNHFKPLSTPFRKVKVSAIRAISEELYLFGHVEVVLFKVVPDS